MMAYALGVRQSEITLTHGKQIQRVQNIGFPDPIIPDDTIKTGTKRKSRFRYIFKIYDMKFPYKHLVSH